jgi:hypothetical protein
LLTYVRNSYKKFNENSTDLSANDARLVRKRVREREGDRERQRDGRMDEQTKRKETLIKWLVLGLYFANKNA